MGGSFVDTDTIELTGKVMVVAVILFIFVSASFFCLHLYANWFWGQRDPGATRPRRRRRLDFSAGHHEITIARVGLHPSVVKSIPVVVFEPGRMEEGMDCAVCLCEVCGGEKARILPKCNHGFHVECIDMWFQSHSTCPLCRSPVDARHVEDSSSSRNGSHGMLVIDIPRSTDAGDSH